MGFKCGLVGMPNVGKSSIFNLLTKQKIIFKTSYPILSLIRVILHFLAFSFYFISLTFMSLAVATALYFSTPLFMSILAKFFLKYYLN